MQDHALRQPEAQVLEKDALVARQSISMVAPCPSAASSCLHMWDKEWCRLQQPGPGFHPQVSRDWEGLEPGISGYRGLAGRDTVGRLRGGSPTCPPARPTDPPAAAAVAAIRVLLAQPPMQHRAVQCGPGPLAPGPACGPSPAWHGAMSCRAAPGHLSCHPRHHAAHRDCMSCGAGSCLHGSRVPSGWANSVHTGPDPMQHTVPQVTV